MNFIKNFLVRSPRQNNLAKAKNPILDLVFIAAIILIAVVSAMSLFEFKNLLNANTWVSHTYEVIGATDSILYNVIDIETHQRGYLLTGDKTFLTEQNAEIDLVHGKLTAIASLTSDMPQQTQRIKELSALINDRIVVLQHVQDLKNQNLLTSTEGLKIFYQGHAITDKIRNMCDTIKKFELNLLQIRNATALDEATTINRILLSGTMISIVSLLIAYSLFSLQLRKRVQAEIHQKNLKSQLTSVIEGASDMIAAMDLNQRFFLFNKAYQDEFEFLFKKKITVGMSIDDVMGHLPKQKDKLLNVWNESLSGQKYTKKNIFYSG